MTQKERESATPPAAKTPTTRTTTELHSCVSSVRQGDATRASPCELVPPRLAGPPFLQGVGAHAAPAPFVGLPLPDGRCTLVDADIAEALRGRRLFLSRPTRGYPAFSARSRNVYVHHVVVGKPTTGDQIDHINGDRLDNRRANLRIVSISHNQLNRHDPARGRSAFRGVRRSRAARWEALLTWQRVRHYGGLWHEPVVAALARDDLVRCVTGFEDGLNFPLWLASEQVEQALSSACEPVVVWFVKRADGAIRRMKCCRAPDVPERRRQRDRRDGLVTILDLDCDEYRCVPLEGILCLRCNSQSYRVAHHGRHPVGSTPSAT